MASSSSGDPIDSHEANWVVANSWKRALRSREQRDAAHIILSAKPGTDPEAFLDAARATLRREFSGHAFVFALHTDRKHLHVHAVVQMTNAHGERIDPKIPDLRRWRETMAEEARRTSYSDGGHEPLREGQSSGLQAAGRSHDGARRRSRICSSPRRGGSDQRYSCSQAHRGARPRSEGGGGLAFLFRSRVPRAKYPERRPRGSPSFTSKRGQAGRFGSRQIRRSFGRHAGRRSVSSTHRCRVGVGERRIVGRARARGRCAA